MTHMGKPAKILNNWLKSYATAMNVANSTIAQTASFRALRVHKQKGDSVVAQFETLCLDDLPPGDTVVRVLYSSLNYKDGLAVMGRPGVLRRYPMIPGIDLVGEVISCETGEFEIGATVILTGWGTGECQDGGYAEFARVQAKHLVALPEGCSPQWAMSVGTAGFTAMLAVLALEQHGVSPQQGEVLVTGAAGGVGSIAVSLLSTAGFEVVASTGRLHEQTYLQTLGASKIMGRQEVTEGTRPLESERWAGVIDSVGSTTLTSALASTRTHGVVAACGLAGGAEFNGTVFPFILRGVTLAGIDSNTCPMPLRQQAWKRLARDLPASKLAPMTRIIPLDEVLQLSSQILEGQIRGRVVLQVQGQAIELS